MLFGGEYWHFVCHGLQFDPSCHTCSSLKGLFSICAWMSRSIQGWFKGGLAVYMLVVAEIILVGEVRYQG